MRLSKPNYLYVVYAMNYKITNQFKGYQQFSLLCFLYSKKKYLGNLKLAFLATKENERPLKKAHKYFIYNL